MGSILNQAQEHLRNPADFRHYCRCPGSRQTPLLQPPLIRTIRRISRATTHRHATSCVPIKYNE
jgi:hypothetical protein